MITQKDIQKYFSIVRNLKTEYNFYDIHVHPFEIIYNNFIYYRDPVDADLYCLGSTKYRKPKISDLNLASENAKYKFGMPKSKLSNLIGLRRVYCHVGPKIFEEHMELALIDGVLLLPVAQSSNSIDAQMNNMRDFFGLNPKFHLGCSVPNTEPNSKISQFIQKNVKKYNIKVIKLHPNITEIDMSTVSGKERVEGVLDSCRLFKLPLIIHGGRSPLLLNREASQYGHIKNFEDINWHTSSEPVVIAHAGGYGCELMEIAKDVLPRLIKLLNIYSNLMIDISGLSFDALVMILKKIDIKRILFGSDSLYHRQWAGLARVMHALINLNYKLEESLVHLASINPLNCIFDCQETRYAKIT